MNGRPPTVVSVVSAAIRTMTGANSSTVLVFLIWTDTAYILHTTYYILTIHDSKWILPDNTTCLLKTSTKCTPVQRSAPKNYTILADPDHPATYDDILAAVAKTPVSVGAASTLHPIFILHPTHMQHTSPTTTYVLISCSYHPLSK